MELCLELATGSRKSQEKETVACWKVRDRLRSGLLFPTDDRERGRAGVGFRDRNVGFCRGGRATAAQQKKRKHLFRRWIGSPHHVRPLASWEIREMSLREGTQWPRWPTLGPFVGAEE